MPDLDYSAPLPRAVRKILIAQGLLLALLFIFSPVAWSLQPFTEIFERGASAARNVKDPLFPLRCALILLGLICSFFIACAGAATLYITRRVDVVSLAGSLTLCALVVGWRTYPYWVMGVFQATGGTIIDYSFDPKALLPLGPFGWQWQLGTLFLYPGSIVGGPLLAGLATAAAIKRKWFAATMSLACLVIVAAVFLSSPNYLSWLMD